MNSTFNIRDVFLITSFLLYLITVLSLNKPLFVSLLVSIYTFSCFCGIFLAYSFKLGKTYIFKTEFFLSLLFCIVSFFILSLLFSFSLWYIRRFYRKHFKSKLRIGLIIYFWKYLKFITHKYYIILSIFFLCLIISFCAYYETSHTYGATDTNINIDILYSDFQINEFHKYKESKKRWSESQYRDKKVKITSSVLKNGNTEIKLVIKGNSLIKYTTLPEIICIRGIPSLMDIKLSAIEYDWYLWDSIMIGQKYKEPSINYPRYFQNLNLKFTENVKNGGYSPAIISTIPKLLLDEKEDIKLEKKLRESWSFDYHEIVYTIVTV